MTTRQDGPLPVGCSTRHEWPAARNTILLMRTPAPPVKGVRVVGTRGPRHPAGLGRQLAAALWLGILVWLLTMRAFAHVLLAVGVANVVVGGHLLRTALSASRERRTER